MSFLGRMLRFLFWFLVISGVLKLLGRLFAAAGHQAEGAKGPEAMKPQKRLVRDPVCGTHMAEELALPLKANGELLHFCSDECRAKYERSMVRHAASA